MASPVYGKQYIRFAETFQVAQGTAVNEFRVVELTGAPGSHPPLLVQQSNGGAAVGVAQYTLNDNVPPTGYATDEVRMLTVATSGLLLVQGDGTLTSADIGTALEVISTGQASTAATVGSAAVTVNGTSPIVRDVIDIGGVQFALVSFS
jgi:DNA/RNA endonuclease YhcR with UshA esterase domain